MSLSPRSLLRALFDRAVAVADPMRAVPQALPPRPKGRVVIVGAGEASARMAEAVEAVWGPCKGLVITRDGHARPCQRVAVIEAAPHVPDAAAQTATARILDLLAGLGEGDFVLALISGGASALLVAPVMGVRLGDKRAVHAALLAVGAPLDRVNAVGKHLSRVKGGQLAAAAYPAQMLALMMSDVPGDDPAFIGSGPTVGDASTPQEALAALARGSVAVPAAVRAALTWGSGVVPPGDARLSRVKNRVIASPAQSLAAAADLARQAGCEVQRLGDRVAGEARDIARAHAVLARDQAARRVTGAAPLVLLSGGDLTVTGRGDGIGGPNAEYALALALALQGTAGIHAIACHTAGIDGAAKAAGAMIGPETLTRAMALGLDPVAHLARNDAHSFFAALGDQVVTGPTLTNVNDFRAILIW